MARIDLWEIHVGLKEIINFTPQNFIEIGSRDGHDTKTIQDMFNIPSKNCYIFEAHPKLSKIIEDTYPEFHINNCAISDKTTPIIFNAADLELEPNPGMSSVLDLNDEEFNSTKVEIDGWRIDDISKYLGIKYIDLVKIDVEGYSLEVLEGFGSLLDKTNCIQIELEHKEVWKNQCSYEEVNKFLTKNNFTQLIFSRIAHNQSDSLWVKNKLILK